MVGKKSSVKTAKKLFLYSYEYRGQKMGTKKHESIFAEKNDLCELKMLGKNCL